MIDATNIYGDSLGRVDLVDHMGCDLTVVNAARVSYGKHKEQIDDADRKLIRYLLKNRHTSPFEHCQLTFRFVVPLFVRSQHHRHRTWAYNEISRRYTSESLKFYFPPFWRKQDAANKQGSLQDAEWPDFGPHIRSPSLPEASLSCAAALHAITEEAVEVYQRMVSQGVAREMARMVLPQNLYTEYYGSVSLHNLMRFLRLRLDAHAQWEIQQAARACLMHAQACFPESLRAWLGGAQGVLS